MSIDWFTFGAQIINFVVLVYLLNYFLYEPITNAMKLREQTIADRLNDTVEREANAESEVQKYDALNKQLEEKRTALLDAARTESEQARRKLIAEARNDVQLRREDWLDALHRDQSALVNMVRQRAGQQVVSVSRKALSQLADADLEHRSLELFVEKLDGLSDEDTQMLKREFAATGQMHVHTAFDVSDSWRKRIIAKLDETLGVNSVSFLTTPDLVCGIELHVGGAKIGWSVQEYLETLSDELEGLLTNQ